MSTESHPVEAAQTMLTPDDSLPPLTARTNVSWSTIGNATYAVSQWAIVIAIARIGTPADVGVFALGLALTAPIVLLTGFQLRAVYATDAKGRFRFAEYLTLRLITSAIAAVVIVILAVTTASRGSTSVIVMIGVAKALEGLSDVFYGVMQKRERMDRLSVSLMMRGAFSLVGVAAAMALTRDLVIAASAYAAVGAITLGLFDVPVARRLLTSRGPDPIRPVRPRGDTLELARLAYPLGIVMFLISVNVNIPRYLVESFLGPSSLGYFAAVAYLYVGGTTLMVAVGESAAPRMSRLYLSDRPGYVRFVTRMAAAAAGLGIVSVCIAWLFGDVLLLGLYGAEYAERSEVLVWLMAAAALGFVSSVLGFALTAARSFRVQVPLFALVALTTLGLSFVLIPRFGLHGAAYAVFGAAVLQVGLTALAYMAVSRVRSS